LEYRTASSPNVTRYTRLSGRDAVVVQHELDHLTGTFFFERASRVAKKKVLEEYENWKKGKKKNAEDYTGQLAPHR
jgi:peptide deformylase